MKKIHVQIINPDGIYLEEDAEMINVFTSAGMLGILFGHMPLVAPIVTSPLEIIDGKKKQLFAVSEGFLKVKPDEVTILILQIEEAHAIDRDRLLKAIANDEDIIAHADDEEAIEKAKLNLVKNKNRLNVSNRLKG